MKSILQRLIFLNYEIDLTKIFKLISIFQRLMFSWSTLKTDFTENFIIIKISIESMETHERFTSFIIKQATVTTEEITSWGKLEG